MAEEVIDIGSFSGKHVILSASFIKENISKISEKPGLNDSYDFPKNRRYFKREWYFTSMATKRVREWMNLSRVTGKVYCLYCFLFPQKGRQFDDSFCNPDKGWNSFHTPARLCNHEKSQHHILAAVQFINTKKRIKDSQDIFSIQRREQDSIDKERRDGLKEIFEVIRFLSLQNIPFRGHSENPDVIVKRLTDNGFSDSSNTGIFFRICQLYC